MTPQDEVDKVLKGEVTYNRAARRRKPRRPHFTIIDYINVPSNIFTKATHKIKKERAKHAPTRQDRIRAASKARKDRKETYTQVS